MEGVLKPDRWQQQAIDLAMDGKCFFVSGKAGTGKTFVLERIVKQMEKKGKSVAVAAPTGVAAHNAGGRTLHSLFGLARYTYTPGKKVFCSLKQTPRESIKALDVLIIDEISMVRCDLLDMVDTLLKQLRNSNKPFGGLQYIFFGDLFQLPPVITKSDKSKLSLYYDLGAIKDDDKCYYFFKSQVIEKAGIKIFELEGNHRQKDDDDFYNLLNNIRERKDLRNTLAKLNKRVQASIPNDFGVFLNTHRDDTDIVNATKLGELKTSGQMYNAVISSEYDEEYPAEEFLYLKKNAKVMLLRNNELHNYYNGSQGVVAKLSSNSVTIQLNGGKTIDVWPETWQQRDLIYDSVKDKLIQNPNAPTFKQLPLRLSWAITVHKSQGMTFDSAIVDVEKAFDHGHVYVALSRCKTLKGLILKTPLTEDVIIVDNAVTTFMKNAERISLHGTTITPTASTSMLKVHTVHSGNKKLTDTLKDTLQYANIGFGISTIAVLRGLTVGTIEGHIASLIEYGYLSVEDYVDSTERKMIISSLKKLGDEASATDILLDCKSKVSYADIRMVKASLIANALPAITKSSAKTTVRKRTSWTEKSNISYGIRSREFFGSKKYRIYTCDDGYYVEVNSDRFIKFGKFARGCNMFDGQIQLKRITPGEEEYRVVHIINDQEHQICTIKEKRNSLHLENNDGDKLDV